MSLAVAVWGGALMLPCAALAQEGKGSLPQLDATTFPGQLFWLAVSFLLLFVLMRSLAVPSVRSGLEKRRSVLGADLDAAKADNDEASALRSAYEQALAQARAKAQSTVNDMALAAAQEEAERRAAQQEELARRVHEAEARIASFRQQALAQARDAAADLASAMVEQLIGRKVS